MKSRFFLVALISVCAPHSLLAQTQQVKFDFVGYPQTWVVPDNVTSITVDARGAQGGGNGSAIPGGKGGRVQTTLAVTPGETLLIYVGGRGGDLNLSGPNTAGPGGFNGGGSGATDNVDFNGPSGGGGGASDIRQGGNGLANRVLVAGGGGGSSCCYPDFGSSPEGPGGDGGDLTGMSGGSSPGGGSPGGGGTQSSGGSGGSGCNGSGSAGGFGQGGAGGNGNRAGGGGGGGYYGGGGGGGCIYGAGGGGGSSFSAGTNTVHTQGYQTGDGQVVINFEYDVLPASSFVLPVNPPCGKGYNGGGCPDKPEDCPTTPRYCGNKGYEFLDTACNTLCGCGNYVLHPGEDWNANDGSDKGDPVYSISNGIVKVVRDFNGTDEWGKVIVVEHTAPGPNDFILTDEHGNSIGGTHKVWSFYEHLDLIDPAVTVGQPVLEGQLIGKVGDANGYYTSAHLHWEIRDETFDHTNPNSWPPDKWEKWATTWGGKFAGCRVCERESVLSYWVDPTNFVVANSKKSPLYVHAYSPVDLIVVDPDLDSIGVSFNTIPGATYSTLNDSVFIGLPISGEYSIKVVKDTLDQSGETTYTLTVQIGNSPPDTLITEAAVPQIGESHNYVVVTNCAAKPGDANASGNYTLGDVISIVNYVFNKPGCSPQPLCWLTNLQCRGDWNGSGTVTLSDVIRGVNYIFNKPGGPWNPVPSGPCCLPVPY